MKKALRWPVAGVAMAIGITSAMDANGLTNFSALPLAPLLGVLWYLQRLPRQAVGFTPGALRENLLAALYPAAVAMVITAVAFAAGALDFAQSIGTKAGINFALVTVSTIIVAILTEEGFFRGWLWASLAQAGISPGWILAGTSGAFSLWHWSAVMLKTGFDPPRAQVPVFMVNAAVLGGVWGMMRWRSGSVIVSSVSHGVWNGMAYVFFGFGSRVGALGIKNTGLFGPEVGILGLALNLTCLAALWLWYRPQAGRIVGAN